MSTQRDIKIAAAFDKWMDDYLNNPEAFENRTRTEMNHLKQRKGKKMPSYGESCAATLKSYLKLV